MFQTYLIMKHTIAVFFFLSIGNMSYSQNNRNVKGRRGEFYFYWGWNVSWYGKSDINFKGKDYDFTLFDVRAKDRQIRLQPTMEVITMNSLYWLKIFYNLNTPMA